jgi:hypothetical protein
MKNNLTEARFQFLAGVINENEFKQLDEIENQSTNKYVDTVSEDGDEFSELNKETITLYLKSVIDPEYIDDVDTFMNDEEGFGESSMHFFDVPEGTPQADESEIEEWAKQEISYYLFSKPDEFPHK